MPLDTFIDDAAIRMEIVGKPKEIPPVQQEVQTVIDKAEGKSWPMGSIERFAFYEAARQEGLLRYPDRRAPFLRLLPPHQRRHPTRGEAVPSMPASSSIVILGVFVADTAYRAPRAPRMGETIIGNSFKLGPGGKGSNQAVAAGRLGGNVSFITKLGKDPFADMALATWKEAGVKPAVTRVKDSYTGAAYIFIEESTIGNQCDHPFAPVPPARSAFPTSRRRKI